MNILIVRSYPTIVSLSSKDYNRQEIGLAKGFLENNHNVSVVYYGKDNFSQEVKYKDKSIHVFFRKQKVVLNRFSHFLDINDLCGNADLIICDEYTQFDSYKIAKKYPEKSIIIHGPYKYPHNIKFLVRNMITDLFLLKKLKKTNPFIVAKSILASDFLEKKGLPVKWVSGVGFDVTQIEEGAEVTCLPAHYCDRKFNLLYIGKIEERRNVVFLIDLLNSLKKINQKFKLVIVGQGNKKYLKKVYRRIEKNHLDDSVVFFEKLQQNQLKSIYISCKYFLLPTDYEIWGMVLMEAMYYGCVPITTYNGGSSSLITNGINGYICKKSIKIWEKTILNDNLDNDNILMINRNIIAKKCNWKTIANKLLKMRFENEK